MAVFKAVGCWLLKEGRRPSIWYRGQRGTTPPPSTYQGRWHEGACLFSPPEGALDGGVAATRAGDSFGCPAALRGYDPRSLHPRVKGL